MAGGIGYAECADRACRPLQRMRQHTRVSGQGGETADQTGRLGRKHRQHLALEPGVAQRHASEMVHVDRTVVGSERRRWHPGDPFQMKRHGDNPIPAPDRSGSEVFGSQSWNWLTERWGSRRKLALFLAKISLNLSPPTR